MAGCYSESMCCSIALVFAENTTCVCTYVCVFFLCYSSLNPYLMYSTQTSTYSLLCPYLMYSSQADTCSSLCPYLMYSTHTPHSVPTSCTAHILLTLSLPHVQHTYSSLCPYLMYSTRTPYSVPTSCRVYVHVNMVSTYILTNRIHRFCMLFKIHTYTHMYVCTKHVYRDIRISYCMYIRRQIVGMVDIGHGCFSSCCVQKPT